MSIALLSAKAGNGHISVMNTIQEELRRQKYYDIYIYPCFFEDILFTNKIMSSFYNYLLSSSIELCKKLSEISGTLGLNNLEQYYYGKDDKILNLVSIPGLEAIISTSHSINNNIIRLLKETELNKSIPFYIVVTDPFDPIGSGFNVIGATKYFCATEVVKALLLKAGIASSRIHVIDYPVSARFNKKYSYIDKKLIYEKIGLYPDKPTILLNSGALGSAHYFELLKVMTKNDEGYQIILICGKNKSMYDIAQNFQEQNRQAIIKVLSFVDNIDELLQISDIVITKAGANTFFECLYTETPVIIDGIYGFLYQEQGVVDYLRDYGVGVLLTDCCDLPDLLHYLFSNGLIEKIKANIKNLNLKNGAPHIVSTVLGDIYRKIT